jgi:hypothetical protein
MSAGDYSPLEGHLSVPPLAARPVADLKYLTRTFIGNFGFVKADAFREVGGFPRDFRTYGQEDDCLAFLLYRRDGRFMNLGSLSVAHVSHPPPDAAARHGWANLGIYRRILRENGAEAFHIGDLLDPEAAGRRPVWDPVR